MKSLSILSLVAGLSFCGSQAAVSADAERGRQIFEKVGCYQCHGFQGQGANTGPKLAPDPLPAEGIAAFIRNSGETLMPNYVEAVLPDADVADIHAYLLTIKKPPSVKDIPLLNQR
ncbi:MAG: cytochrome c, mono- and diheme variant family [Hyphomicrobiales bacterium]|nr:cytochrome c, mono- and diheme variant family [Hyphomicrobiales bacterium]